MPRASAARAGAAAATSCLPASVSATLRVVRFNKRAEQRLELCNRLGYGRGRHAQLGGGTREVQVPRYAFEGGQRSQGELVEARRIVTHAFMVSRTMSSSQESPTCPFNILPLSPPSASFASMRGHHVALRVPDFEAEKRFFVEKLDFAWCTNGLRRPAARVAGAPQR